MMHMSVCVGCTAKFNSLSLGRILLCNIGMLFSSTKIENAVQTGVFLKKKCWRGYSSPREDKEFFRKLTINTLTTGFLLVLPKFHSFDGRISLEETLVKRRMHKSEHLKGNLIIFIQHQSTLDTKYSIVGSSSFSL